MSRRLIRGRSSEFPRGAWLFVVLILGLTAFTVFLVRHPDASHQHIPPYVVVIPLLILLLVGWHAVVGTLRFVRYRKLALEITPATTVAGDEFSGSLWVPIPFERERRFGVVLNAVEYTCERRTKSDSSSRRSEDDYENATRGLHHQSVEAAALPAPNGTRLRFVFHLPEDALPTLGYAEPALCTRDAVGRVWVKWFVTVSAEVPGVNLDESFEIPVIPRAGQEYRVPASSSLLDLPIVRRVIERLGLEHDLPPDDARPAPGQVHTYARPQSPAAVAVSWAVTLLAFGYVGWWGYLAVEETIRKYAQSPSPVMVGQAGPVAPVAANAPAAVESGVARGTTSTGTSATAEEELRRLSQARQAVDAQRYDKAADKFRETLALVESKHGASSPLAALVHFNESVMHQRRKNLGEQERALKRAFAIMEKYSDAEWRRVPGMSPTGVDAAQVAADLGYIYWEWRRVEESHAWYDRAHEFAAALSTTEENRNQRLAVSAAGLMVTSCALGKWDIADKAMAELKQRMTSVDPDLRAWLDYWVRTGEPRLKARQC